MPSRTTYPALEATVIPLVARAHAFHAAQLASGPDRDQRATRDHLFLSRFAPGVGEIVRWADSPQFRIEVAVERDVPDLLAIVRKHEGDASAAFAARWFEVQLDRVLIVRDPRGAPAGFVAPIALERATSRDREADPAARAAWAVARSLGPLRKGDVVMHFRFWMAKDSYQGPSEAQSLCMMTILNCEVTTPNLLLSFWPCREPEAFAEVTRHSGSPRLPAADFAVGGQTYGVYFHDWRRRSRAMWLSKLAEAAGGSPGPPPGEHLDERAFRRAVVGALKAYAADFELSASPLLLARFVTSHVRGVPDGVSALDALRAEVRAAVEALGGTPRGRKLALALMRTYLTDERATQEAVAEALGLPFSTYRRHLTAGTEAVAAWLWNRERSALGLV